MSVPHVVLVRGRRAVEDGNAPSTLRAALAWAGGDEG